MNTILVSVIIPAYNSSITICRAVESVLAQTIPADEIIVVDDGSSDDLKKSLGTLERRVAYFRKPNGGAASARNFGIEQSRGQMIAFLDADDYWEANKLKLQIDIFKMHPEIGMVASQSYEQIPGQMRSKKKLNADVYLDRVVVANDAIFAFEVMMNISTGSAIVRRDTLGNHRFDETLRTAEDRDLWFRLVISNPVYLMSAFLYTAVLESNSLSRSGAENDYPNFLEVLRRYSSQLGSRATNRLKAEILHEWAATSLGTDGRPKAALAPLLRYLCLRPLSFIGWYLLFKIFISLTFMKNRA